MVQEQNWSTAFELHRWYVEPFWANIVLAMLLIQVSCFGTRAANAFAVASAALDTWSPSVRRCRCWAGWVCSSVTESTASVTFAATGIYNFGLRSYLILHHITGPFNELMQNGGNFRPRQEEFCVSRTLFLTMLVDMCCVPRCANSRHDE